MIDFEGLGHLKIVVKDIRRASAFYERAFGAVSLQEFPHFRNDGFARSAGFLNAPAAVDVSIRFLRLPTPEGVILELMEYHHPAGVVCCQNKVVNALNCVGHIALRVKDIDAAFAHVSAVEGVSMIHPSADYRPFKIDPIEPDEFRFFDPSKEADANEKEAVCRIIGSIRYFYFLDPYGVQWEFEQGHSDMGTE